MGGRETWSANWQVVSPPGCVRIDLGSCRGSRRTSWRQARHLPIGTPAALFSAGPLSRGRVRRFAVRSGISIEREYLVFPALSPPSYLVEDSPETIRHFCLSSLTVPPGTTLLTGLVDGTVRILRRSSPRLIGALAPGRVAVGFRK